jgi:anti-sigma regulatory factor (Ser/Thr protein kinase)
VAASVRILLEESSQSAEARRTAVRMASDIGFNEVRAGEVAIVVTEACTNILKHAGRGEVLLRFTGSGEHEGAGLELLAIDKGPGMRNLDECLRDGYTTSSSPGQGLGAIKRLAGESDFYSATGDGAAILARWQAPRTPGGFAFEAPRLRVGAVNVCKPGQDVCGDSWGIEDSGEVATVMVADGLGHGYEASQASLEAVRVLRDHPERSPKDLVELCHRALRSSRGAAVAVARIDRMRGVLAFAGVGNVAAQIYEGSKRAQHLVSVNGTAGHEVPRIREFNYPWPDEGMLLMHSDGLTTGTGLESRPVLALHDPALIAGVLYRDYFRGQDDATVVVAKAA